MAVAVLFNPPAMSAEQYDEVTTRLEAAGAGTPAGRVDHVCFGPSDKLRVFDLWDSEDNFDAFIRTLLPILEELGLNSGEPEVFDVHNIMADRRQRHGQGVQRPVPRSSTVMSR